jgi:hypothetical protein
LVYGRVTMFHASITAGNCASGRLADDVLRGHSWRKAAVEATVVWKSSIRRLSFFVVLACFLMGSFSARAQDAQPSVADAARQARKGKEKDKTAGSAKAVITDDNMSSAGGGSGVGGPGLAAPELSGKADATDNPWAKLRETEVALDRLASLDRTQLAQLVLKSSEDFPGRRDWEYKLFSAKVSYVGRSRQLVEAMKQALTEMESLQSQSHGKIDPNDPRAQELGARAQQIMKLTVDTEAAFQAVVGEGQSLAHPGKPR